jgi:N-acetyl-gamma-glutamyl-phosphate reductase
MVFKVAVAGASGYVGGELLRLIAMHPELELGAVTANTNAGQLVSALHPHLKSYEDRVFVETSKERLAGHDIVFLALPHATSAEVAAYLPESVVVLDCGADFRLEDSKAWEKFYGTAHAGTWAYGMPELTLASGGKQRQNLHGVTRVAVPGCNVTAITLALAPALSAGLIEPQDIVSVLSVGTSGAGRSLKADLLASEVQGSARAYGVGGIHRHTPEIEQNLAHASGSEVKVSFTPVLVPMSRGILAVNTAKVSPGFSFAKLVAAYEQAYGDEVFVQVLSEGQQPNTSSVLGANTAQISLSFDESAQRVVIVSAIDNLVKGTAGAAIQSMNLALGLPETLGLPIDGVAP